MVPVSVRVRVFGGVLVEGFSDRDLGSRKGRLLLKVLLMAQRTGVGTVGISV